MKEQVAEAVVRRLQISFFLKICKFHRKTSVLEYLFDKAAGLKACKTFRKMLQHKCFPVKFEKFLRTYRRVSVADFEVSLVFTKDFGTKPSQLSAINTRFS